MSIKYSKELLESIAKVSVSVAEVIRKLGLKQSGGNHTFIKAKLSTYGIDTLHFLGKEILRTKRFNNKLLPAQVLVNDRYKGRRTSAATLRRALLESGIEHKCQICGLLPYWNGQYLQLQVDHINGVGTDNRIENLRFVCGNCHIQTDNFGIKNSTIYLNREVVIKTPKPIKEIVFKPAELNPNWRNIPRPDSRKVVRPSEQELERLLWEKPTTQLAKEFGVSSKAIEKWAKSYGISKPPRGYWMKIKNT